MNREEAIQLMKECVQDVKNVLDEGTGSWHRDSVSRLAVAMFHIRAQVIKPPKRNEPLPPRRSDRP